MFAFQLPFGSMNEARHAVLPHGMSTWSDSDSAPLGDAAPETAEPQRAIVATAAEAPAHGDAASASGLPFASGEALDNERLLALLAAALRDVDCGVVVCNSAQRLPAFLFLGRRRDIVEAEPGIAFGPDAPGRAGVRSCDDDRSLLTLLFTDIVASTEMAERLGDEAWRTLLERHRAIVREQLAAFRGTEVDNAGDGFFATFDRPARAIRCAAAIDRALAGIGISIRAGIHAGECATSAGHVSGVAVHVASRIVEVANPREILVSGTVRDLVAGSGLEFCDRDWHALKGLSGSRQLFALQCRAATS